jgi:DNA mismatch repair protein MutS2
MDDHTLELLEWPAIQGMLAEEAESPLGVELAGALRPLASLEEAQRLQDEIGEFRALLTREGGLPFRRLADIRDALHRARPEGAVLSPRDLLDIAAVLEAAEAIRIGIGRARDHCPKLHARAARLDGHPALVAEVRAALDETGEVTDAASRELASVRRRLRDLRDLIDARLRSLLADPSLQPHIAEPIITLRNDRYVIPVRANSPAALRGVVQDRSASGVTVFVEPQPIVELNNHLRLLQRAEEEEIRKVLAALTARLRPHLETVRETLHAAAELEVRCAAARLADRLDGAALSLKHGGSLALLEARHPLLLRQATAGRGEAPVPIDFRIGGDFDALVITGPNTGGKTVALKTAGLLSVMALAGLHVPASPDSEVPFFANVLADIGDEQGIEQSLSTFSSHVGQIRRIVGAAGPATLVLLDELGAGTDPVEGACLGIAILEALLDRGALVVATSHLDAIKAYAYSHPRIENGCVEFDLDTLKPLYRLSIGLFGRSHALEIASRIGLPSSVIERARLLLGAEDDRLRVLLERLEREERRVAEERAVLSREMARATRARSEAEAQRDAALAEALDVAQEARQQAQAILSEARAEVDRLLREFRSAVSKEQAAHAARARLAELERKAQHTVADRSSASNAQAVADGGSIGPGQRVRIRGLEHRGTVIGEPTAAGLVEIQLPLGKVRLPVGAVIPEERAAQNREAGPVRVERAPGTTPLELNLIGCDAEEAARRLDRYVGDAFLAGLPSVRVVHGKGAGVLRRTVARVLQGHPLVVTFRTADYREGGIGATVVELHPRDGVAGGP